MPHQARFYPHPRGAVFASIPENVNFAFVEGILYTKPAKKDRDLCNCAMALFVFAGVVAVGVDSRFAAFARARDVFSLGDVSIGGGQSINVLNALDHLAPGRTDNPAFFRLGGCLCSDETDQVVDLSLGDASYTTGRFIDDSPALVPVSTLTESSASFYIGESSEGATESTSDGHERSLSDLVDENSLALGVTLPISEENNRHVNSDDKGDNNIVSLPDVQGARLPPPATSSPSQSTLFDIIGTLNNQNPFSLNWNAIIISLTVIVGLKRAKRGVFRRPAIAVKSGQKKNETDGGCKSAKLLQSVVDANPSPVAHIGGRPESTGECYYPLPVIPNFGHLTSSLVNSTTESPENGPTDINTSYGALLEHGGYNGFVQPGHGLVHITLFLSLLATMALVCLGSTLTTFVENSFKATVLQLFESSVEVNVCEELENAVPGSLLRDDLVPADTEPPARSAPPLGCVVLTASGPCTIDPRPNRQITEEEDTDKFGLPVEALAYPPSPLVGLTSCIADSRPGSPTKIPRKVTFADENEVFILPRVNVTRDRNLRRRLCRRLIADAGKNNNAPAAKRR